MTHPAAVPDALPELLITSEAARILGLTPAAVRLLADSGRLPTLKTPTGVRLYRRADVLAERRRRLAN
jgi:DNA-binding transcriptional MerR regulator